MTNWLRPLALIGAVSLVLGVQPVHADHANPVIDPSFEAGRPEGVNPNWTEVSSGDLPLTVFEGDAPHSLEANSGDWMAYLCGYDACAESLSQTVALPPNTLGGALSFHYVTASEDGNPDCSDSLNVILKSGAHEVTASSLCEENTDLVWVPVREDVDEFLQMHAGESIELVFAAVNDEDGEPNFFSQTLWYIDDIALELVHHTTHVRTISLSLRRHLVAKGSISSFGAPAACVDGVTVKIQRRRANGTWATVATAVTGLEGFYSKRIDDRPGTYRAVAPRTVLDGLHTCAQAKAPTEGHTH